ncbi:MAG: hypothetical protein ACRDAX_10120, partial [Propionibacteriaceae bacterium]
EREKERELYMLLKQNTVNADEIEKHSIGIKTLREMEELAVNLEQIENLWVAVKEEKREEKVDVHAIMNKVAGGQQQSSYPGCREPCAHCGRRDGHEVGWKCTAMNSRYYDCGETGRIGRACPLKASTSSQ